MEKCAVKAPVVNFKYPACHSTVVRDSYSVLREAIVAAKSVEYLETLINNLTMTMIMGRMHLLTDSRRR
jgi:hypothetical protein